MADKYQQQNLGGGNGQTAPESIERIYLKTEDAFLIPGKGMLTMFEAHPKTGKGWSFEWHKAGYKISHPDLAKYGSWIIPYSVAKVQINSREFEPENKS